MARRVTEDRTWVLAIHGDDAEPRPGVYEDEQAPPSPVSDLYQWAAVTGGHQGPHPVIAIGPWGAFLLLHLPVGEGNRAELLAPWEGRPEPSGADMTLLSLVAQHAGVTLDHAKLYATVRAQAQELERLSAVQRDFLRGVTHDLQSPLASIAATATDLRERLQETHADDELQVIADQTGRLQRMVVQLLTMSGLEAGVVRPSIDVFRAGPIVERVVRSIRPEGEIVYVPSGPDRLAVGDADRLEQVLWAVLDNAIKYSPAHTPIEVRTSLLETDEGPQEGISVADRGVGMDAETARHAFDQFYRAEAARRLAPNGSGIGLFTARSLMALMGGAIAVESSLGSGTTVRLRLPAELVDVPGPGPA
jgi:signal transduction histidine kinase